MSRRLLIPLLFSCGMLFSTLTHGQSGGLKTEPAFRQPSYKAADRDIKTGIDIDNWTDQTARDISRVRPGAFTANPTADRAVVRSVFKNLKTQRENLSDEDVLQAVFAAWVELAVKGFDKQGKEVDYTEADLLKAAANQGKLKIETEPEGATIQVDGYEKTEKSNAVFWFPAGKYTIILDKAGYKKEPRDVVINLSEPSALLKVKLTSAK